MKSILAAIPTNNSISILFGIIFSIIGIGTIIYAYSRRNTNFLKQWIEIGQGLGIELNCDKRKEQLKLVGTYKGFNMAFCAVFIKSSISQTNTEIYLDKNTNLNLYITKKTGSFLQSNTKSINIGDSTFNKAFFIKSKTPEKVINFLKPEIKKQLINNIKLFEKGSLFIDDNTIKWLGKKKSNSEFQKQVLDLLINIETHKN